MNPDMPKSFLVLSKISYKPNFEPPLLRRQRAQAQINMEIYNEPLVKHKYSYYAIPGGNIIFGDGYNLNPEDGSISHYDGNDYIFLGFFADIWSLTTSETEP